MPKKQHKTPSLADADYWIALWLNECSKSPHTNEAYRRDVKAFLDSAAMPFDKVTPVEINRYKDHLSGAPATRRRKITSLRSFYDFLNSRNITDVNLSHVKLPDVKREIKKEKILSEAEIKAMIEAARPDRDGYLFVRFLYLTGARVSEAVGLKWRDLVETDDSLYANLRGKGNKTREVPISPKLWQEIHTVRDGAADDSEVFPSIKNRKAAGRMIAKLGKAIKLGRSVSPHWFRHSCASHLLAVGADVVSVRDLLGHKSIATTNLYAHASNTKGLANALEKQLDRK